MSRWLSVSVLAISSFSFASNVMAQDDAMVEIYGQGIHRYFAGDYREAERLLSMVVDSGSQDPRAHYFRGLSQYMQGRSQEAKYDFENGAMAEARGKRVVPVGMSLQRVQGAVRCEIEKARQSARIAVIVEQAQARRMREDAARAQGGAMPSGGALSPNMPVPIPPTSADATDPFAKGGGLQAGKPSAQGAQPTPPAADKATDPFRDDPVQGAAPGTLPAPATPDPFAPATPATPSAPSTTADPFSAPDAAAPTTDGAATADPFSAPATPAPSDGGATADDPFATPPTAPPAT